MNGVVIGVLDIQGSVKEHLAALRKIGVQVRPVKTKADLDTADGLILPGGESTTIGKLLKKYGLDNEIRRRIKVHTLSLWGTCAGAILLSRKVEDHQPDILKLMDITIARNAYGRQVDSFETELAIPELGKKKVPAIFIRAPRVKKVGSEVQIMAEYEGEPVMIRQGNLLATMFHPELTEDTRAHEYFIEMTNSNV